MAQVRPSETRSALPPWRRLQAISLFIVAASLVAVMGIARTIIPPLIVFSLIYAALGAAVIRWGDRRWVVILAAALALAGLAGNMPFLMEDLAHPESWGSFVPSALSVINGLASVVAAGAGLAGLTSNLARPVELAASGLSTVAVMFSLAAWSGVVDDAQETGDVVVETKGIEYPETLSVPTGGALLVANEDPVHHTFVIESDPQVKLDVPANASKRLVVTLPIGEYRYLCDVPGHERMEGTLTVQ